MTDMNAQIVWLPGSDPIVKVVKMPEAGTFGVWVKFDPPDSITGACWECHSSGIPTAPEALDLAKSILEEDNSTPT